jgi:hypothetical protein
MATTTNVTTSYAGKYAGEYIRATFLANDTVNNVTFKENIDYKAVVKRITDDITFANATCDFAPTGTINITERILELKKLQVQRNLCLNDFLSDWGARDVQNGQLEPALTENVIATMLEGMAQKNESLIWTGSIANAGEYDGFLQQIGTDADGDINFVATPVTINSGNVIAKLQLLIAELPQAVKQANEKPSIYMSADVWEAYMYANAAAGNGWYTYGGAEVPKLFMGLYPIVVAAGMPVSTMIMTRKSNLWFGTNIMSDWNNILVAPMTQFGEDNVRFSAKFFAGCQYGFGSEIAAYSTWF